MSIKLTTEKSTLEKNLERIEAPLILVENCVKSAVHNLNSSFEVFWSLPDDQIEEILNYFGPVKVQEVFGAHFENAEGFNRLLDSREVSGVRAITVKPREITMDAEGRLVLVPLPVVEEPVYYDEPVVDEFGNPIPQNEPLPIDGPLV